MGFFDILGAGNINKAVEECRSTQGALLVDVRTPDEYAGGHIPGAVSIPLPLIEAIEDRVQDKDTPVYLYCLSGSRAGYAAQAMRRMGYTKVKNIGGIKGYKGEKELD